MNLEDIMLSEINQSQKDKYCMRPRVVKFIQTEGRIEVTRGTGEGGGVII